MSQQLPCPNPNCGHVFPTAAVAAGSLRCPACGTTFEFRAAAPVARTAKTQATGPANEAAPAPLAFSAAPVARPRPRGTRQSRPALVWGSVFVVLAVLVAAGAYALRTGKWKEALPDVSDGPEIRPAGAAHVSRDFNYRFTFPGDNWQKDDALKVAIKANALALVRTDPPAWIALAARDYRTANPDAGQLLDEATRRLGGYFENLESERRGEVELAGQKAQRLVFQGKANGTMMSGECATLAHRGIGYWLATWTTAAEAQRDPARVRDDFDRARRGFAFGRDREQWKEQRQGQTFAGKQAGYEFRAVAGPWKEWPTPKDEDPKADLLLIGTDPDAPKDISRNANVAVLLLDPAKDLPAAVAQARAHVEARQKETYPETTAEVIADRDWPSDRDAPVGGVPGHIVQLRVKNGETRERYLVLAVVVAEELGRTLVIQCECDWKRRTRWEPMFPPVLAAFRLKAKPATDADAP